MSADKTGTILVVDDDHELRALVVELIGKLGVSIVEASDGQEAMDQFLKYQPDAILSDLKMPNKTGLQFLRELRDMGHRTPFVILTGHADKEKAITALRLGAMDFVDKPFNRKKLLASVERAYYIGLAHRDVEKQLDQMAIDQKVPKDKLEIFKRAKRAVMLQKIINDFSKKKSA